MPRRTPYTAIGIKRCKCVRCGAKAHAQWNICALGVTYHPICRACDIDINRLVLRWLRHPKKTQLLKAYKEKP
jgi:hypothetical protein